MATQAAGTRIGVIADTHGLVRPLALRALRGSALIVHAGDIGSPDVLEALRAIAPVVAVRGNNDRGPWARGLRAREVVEVGGARLLVVHDVTSLRGSPPGVAAVIAGHSHRPSITERDGVMFLNPGSAGPRRFSLPVTVATLHARGGRLRARIVDLPVAAATTKA